MAVSAEEISLLDELKAAAQKLGIEVREERLLREVGYRVRSGACRVRDNEVILLDRRLQVNAQIDVLIDELAGRALDNIYLSPAARALLERAAAKEKRSDACGESTSG